MDVKQKIDSAQTYVLDEDVMDEMENVEATSVLHPAPTGLTDSRAEETGFLEDIEAGTVILNDALTKKA